MDMKRQTASRDRVRDQHWWLRYSPPPPWRYHVLLVIFGFNPAWFGNDMLAQRTNSCVVHSETNTISKRYKHVVSQEFGANGTSAETM